MSPGTTGFATPAAAAADAPPGIAIVPNVSVTDKVQGLEAEVSRVRESERAETR